MALVALETDTGPGSLIECLETVPAAQGSRLQFSWGHGTEIRLCEVLSPATISGGEEPHGAICKWSPLGTEQRRIAFDIVPWYTRLRQTLHNLGADRQQEVKIALQEYSSNVLAILKMTASDASVGPPADIDALQVAYEAGLWQLLELFFLSDDTQEGFFAEAFCVWLAEHGGLLCSALGYNALAAEARRLRDSARVDNDPSYWPTVQRLVLLGQLEQAAQLLVAHTAYQNLQVPAMAAKVESIEAVYQLLRVVPRFSRAGGSSSGGLGFMGTLTDDVVQFSSERATWRRRVDELWHDREQFLADMKKVDPAASKGLAGLLCLLCAGSDNSNYALTSFRYASSIAGNWVELLAGTLFWKYPTLQPQLHFRQLLAKIQGAQGLNSQQSDENFLDFLHQLLLASADQEVQSVIALCTNSPHCSLQFVAHIFDVLRGHPSSQRVISIPLAHYGVDQSELFTLNYAETLLGHVDTWLLAAEYLAWCPVNGAAVMEAMFDKSPSPVQDDRTALKALALAQKHGLTASAAGLARRLGRAAAQAGRFAAALQWMMRAHDPAACAELVAPLLGKVQLLLLQQVGNYRVSVLDIPELRDLEPLLAQLPDQQTRFGLATTPQQQLSGSRQQRRPYQELQCLRAFAQLQSALADVQHCQQQPVQQQQQLLAAAYAAVQQPVVELLLEGLAPAAVQLPLLLYLVPVLESVHMPFSRAEVLGLLQLTDGAAGEAPTAAAAVLNGGHDAAWGLRWPVIMQHYTAAAGVGSKHLHSRHVSDVRLALCRCLVKTHIIDSSLQVPVN